MVDPVAQFRAASEANDIDALMGSLSPDAGLVSPLSGRLVFSGQDDLRVLLGAVYGALRGLRWTDEVGDESIRVVLGEARIGPFTLGDAMVLELDGAGRIQRIRPHLRPWLSVTLFALMLGPRMARHPGILRRAAVG